MENLTPPDHREILKQQALATPHGLFLIDTLLKIKAQDGQVQLSLGWENPVGGIAPVATLSMTSVFAKQLIRDLESAINNTEKV